MAQVRILVRTTMFQGRIDMRKQEIRIGDKVKDRNGFEFEVVALFKDGTVYCDFEGNEGDVWEFKVDELKKVLNNETQNPASCQTDVSNSTDY